VTWSGGWHSSVRANGHVIEVVGHLCGDVGWGGLLLLMLLLLLLLLLLLMLVVPFMLLLMLAAIDTAATALSLPLCHNCVCHSHCYC
jgi:hypothetical protein